MSLSAKQIRQLGIVSSAAAKHQRALGVLTAEALPADMRTASKTEQDKFWRHQQVALCTQRVCSFNDMINDEYRPMMQHFEALAGPDYKERAVASTVRTVENAACHRVPGCEWVRDMYHWLAKAEYKEGYAIAIMKAKFRGITDIRLLREHELKQLHDTVVNRCRAKLGKGDPDNRNKKERFGHGPAATPQPRRQPAAETPPLPPQAPANGSPPPPVSRSRTYILKPRPATQTARIADPDNEPF